MGRARFVAAAAPMVDTFWALLTWMWVTRRSGRLGVRVAV